VRSRGVGSESGKSRVRLLLASSSLAALLIGGGAPAAFAQCAISPTTNQPFVSNAAANNCINIHGISVGGNVTNTSTGMLTTNGAAPPSRTGVTITNNASVGGVNSVMISTFYGNFAAGHQTYGGTGTVRYTW